MTSTRPGPSVAAGAPHASAGAGAGRVETSTGVSLVVEPAELRRWLDEDLGEPWEDVTTDPLFASEEPVGAARLVAREACVCSGLEEAGLLFQMCGATFSPLVEDGERASAGSVLGDVRGPVRAILRAERTALNVVGRMSGIATLTADVQTRVRQVNPQCRVAATRKTTPGFRRAEKRAVWHGGGDPHRWGLFDQVLVKDNHRAAATDLEQLMGRLRAHQAERPAPLLIEVEVEGMDEAEVAARHGADIILVDNQGPEGFARIAARLREIAPHVTIEASGGIGVDDAPAYAAHADRISMGALTQAARSIDVGLDWSA